MDTCKKIQEKLLFMSELSGNEEKEVKQHLGSCEICREEFAQIQSIETALGQFENANHVDDELLVRYSIHLSDPGTSDYDGRALSRKELKRIELHTTRCTSCQARVDQLVHEYREVADYLEQVDMPDLTIKPVSGLRNLPAVLHGLKEIAVSRLTSLTRLVTAPVPRLVPVTVGAMAALFAILWLGPFYRSDNPYWDLTNLPQEQTSFVTRSHVPARLQEGLAAFTRGDYASAISALEQFETDDPARTDLFYVDYILGVSYLMEARTDIWGRFQSIDESSVEKAIQNLQNAKRASNNLRIEEDCDWYLAKAFLLLRDNAKARASLERIISLRGKRFVEAKRMLNQLDTLESK